MIWLWVIIGVFCWLAMVGIGLAYGKASKKPVPKPPNR